MLSVSRNSVATIMRSLGFGILLLLPLVPPAARGEIGDATLTTTHPHYPGEGAFQTPEQCVQWATAAGGNSRERALAVYNWLLTHQWHLHSPQEWNIPGRIPGAQPEDSEMMVSDANRGRFSYGYGLCGTVHAWNEAYWRALGLEARRRAFPGHTNSEVLIDGRWRMLDTDMAGVVFQPDGSLAGYDEIVRDLSLLTRSQSPWPRYPFAWPSDFRTMQRGWEEVARGGNWYKLYHGGYAAHPGIVHLRSGETFTRYYDPDVFGGPSRRRFWHRQPGGPARDWTFFDQGTPFHDGATSNCRSHVSFGNALFDYHPDLTSDRFREGVAAASLNLSSTARGLQSRDAQPAWVVFEHFSPYVICGDPIDDENPLTHPATEGLVVRGEAAGPIHLQVSPDQGQTWSPLQELSGEFQLDLTEAVKGRYGWQLKLLLPAGSHLTALQTTTTCQLNPAMYPRLTAHGTTVTWRAAGRAVEPVLPLLVDEQATIERFERRDLRSENMEFVGRGPQQRLAYRVLGPRRGWVVFRVPARTPLVGVAGAARFAVRSPTPEGAEFALTYSLDGGVNWSPLGRAAPPTDNEFSSGWVFGTAQFDNAIEQEVLVRVDLFGGGAATGLLAVELYGLRQTQCDSPATVTYEWREGDQLRRHAFTLPAGMTEATAEIPTGAEVRDHAVHIAVE